MSEIDAMKALEVHFEDLDTAARKRILDWGHSKYVEPTFAPASKAVTPGRGAKRKTSNQTNGENSKRARKSKVAHKLIKDLVLAPRGKPSVKEFAAEKCPTNGKEKCLVGVYYLRDMAELEAVSSDHVYTFFKFVGWRIPSDLVNTLQQAGSEGWLDTASKAEIKVTHMGEKLD